MTEGSWSNHWHILRGNSVVWRFVCVFIQRLLPAQFFLLILLYLMLIWRWRWSPDVTVSIKCIWISTVLYLLEHGGCVCSNYPPKSFFYSPHNRWGNIENGSEHNIVYSSLVTLTRRHLLLLQLCFTLLCSINYYYVPYLLMYLLTYTLKKTLNIKMHHWPAGGQNQMISSALSLNRWLAS